jgi:hypothetical protein
MNEQEHRRQDGQWNPPQSRHGDSDRSVAALHPKASMSVFYVVLFLLGVYMSLSNIRHAVKILPDMENFDGYANHMDKMTVTERPQKYLYPETTAATHGNESNADDNGAPPLLSVVPNANNTVISIISMGRLVETFLVERCIRSIRQRGLFTGTIIVFTDSEGYNSYQETIPSWDNRTIIIQGKEDDMNPREATDEGPERNHTEPQLKKYAQKTMVFKRFKTHHSKYIREYPDLSNSIRFVMYADVDNIIGSQLDPFFEDYTKGVIDQYQKATEFHRNFTSTASDGIIESAAESTKSESGGFGFVSMFRDRHLRSKMHR